MIFFCFFFASPPPLPNQVMLDTVGPELQVVNKTERSIPLKADSLVVLTPDQNKEASSNLLPINFSGLSKVSNNTNVQYIFLKCFNMWILG